MGTLSDLCGKQVINVIIVIVIVVVVFATAAVHALLSSTVWTCKGQDFAVVVFFFAFVLFFVFVFVLFRTRLGGRRRRSAIKLSSVMPTRFRFDGVALALALPWRGWLRLRLWLR